MTINTEPMQSLLDLMILNGASDLHISTRVPPRMRIDGQLHELDTQPISAADLRAWLNATLASDQRDTYMRYGDVDFGIEGDSGGRYRVSLYRERGQETLAIRLLNEAIPTMDEIGLPLHAKLWTDLDQGLVLVAGPTGCGKSTTIASMVNRINHNRPVHIVTVEDPIEYVLPPAIATVRQRQIGTDVASFSRAARAALREDVDVLVIGELRDAETMAAALAVAETGHLVFATMHTNNAEQALDRLIDAFAEKDKPLIRSRLAATLIGVIYQRLLPTGNGRRIAAFEILTATSAVRNLIREAKTFQIPNTMVTGTSHGMQTMADALAHLVADGHISTVDVDRFLISNPQ